MKCPSGKSRYYSWKIIKKVIGRTKKHTGITLRVYHCNECGGIHLTSMGSHGGDFNSKKRLTTRLKTGSI